MGLSSKLRSGLLFVGLGLLLAGCYQTAGSSVIPTVAELTATYPPPPVLPTIPSDTPAASPIPATIAPTNTLPPTIIPAVSPTLIALPALTDTPVPAQPAAASPIPPTDTPFVTAISTQGFLTPTSGGVVITIVKTPGSTPPATAATAVSPAILNTPTALPTEGNCVHTVQPGDHVYSIARQYKVDVNALIAANPFLQGNPDQLQVGQQLVIPNCGLPTATLGTPPTLPPNLTPTPVGPTLYAVVKGDTLLIIAHKFNTTVANLEAANGLTDNSILHIGQQLIIPPPS